MAKSEKFLNAEGESAPAKPEPLRDALRARVKQQMEDKRARSEVRMTEAVATVRKASK